MEVPPGALDELRDWDVTNWRNKLQEGRRKNSANRDLRSFKAALNNDRSTAHNYPMPYRRRTAVTVRIVSLWGGLKPKCLYLAESEGS